MVLPHEEELLGLASYFGGWIHLASLLSPTYFTHFTLIAVFLGSLVQCEDCQLVSVSLAEGSFTAKLKQTRSVFPLFQFIGPYKKLGRVISLGTKTIRLGPC